MTEQAKQTEHMEFVPMNTARLLDTVFAVYKRSYKAQILRVIVVGAIISATNSVVIGVSAFGMVLGGGGFLASAAALIVFAAVAMSLYTGAGVHMSTRAYKGEKATVSDALGAVFRSFLRLFTANVFTILLYIPMALMYAFYLWFMANLNNTRSFTNPEFYFEYLSDRPSVASAVAVSIIFFAVFIAYFLFVQSITSCSTAAAMYEHRHFADAFKRSLALTKGFRLKIAGAFALWYLVLYSIYVGFALIIIAAIPALFTLIGGESGFSLSMVASMLFVLFASILTALFLAPLTDILTALIYANQKIKKEGYNLIFELETINAGI